MYFLNVFFLNFINLIAPMVHVENKNEKMLLKFVIFVKRLHMAHEVN